MVLLARARVKEKQLNELVEELTFRLNNAARESARWLSLKTALERAKELSRSVSKIVGDFEQHAWDIDQFFVRSRRAIKAIVDPLDDLRWYQRLEQLGGEVADLKVQANHAIVRSTVELAERMTAVRPTLQTAYEDVTVQNVAAASSSGNVEQDVKNLREAADKIIGVPIGV